MKNKKIVIIFVIIFIFVIIGGFFAIKYVKNQQQEENKIEEYTPEEEVADNQLRQTIVSLYFPSKDSKEIVPEARLVDIKEIINNPYEKLFNLLIEGPKNEKEEKIIPEGTKILNKFLSLNSSVPSKKYVTWGYFSLSAILACLNPRSAKYLPNVPEIISLVYAPSILLSTLYKEANLTFLNFLTLNILNDSSVNADINSLILSGL